MKKFLALLLMVVMSFAILTGCSDPVYDDLDNFLNVEMTEVNADYEKIKAEIATWETLADDAALAKSLNEVLIPLVDSSLEKLENINPATDEVKDVKEKYVDVMEAYKEGFTALAEGCVTQDEATIKKGYESAGKAVELLDVYNNALEELAAEHGGEIEY